MRTLEVRNRDRGTTLGNRIRVADSPWSRLRGYLGRPEPEEGEGILFVGTESIHMYGMKYALDVAFLDGEGWVVAVYPELRAGARTRRHPEARYALEVPPGTLAATGTAVGDRIEWEGPGGAGPHGWETGDVPAPGPRPECSRADRPDAE